MITRGLSQTARHGQAPQCGRRQASERLPFDNNKPRSKIPCLGTDKFGFSGTYERPQDQALSVVEWKFL
jgi:hypothetical protein